MRNAPSKIFVGVGLLALLCAPLLAWARASSELSFSVAEVFSSAVRFVRVDRGCKVTDKDGDAAYVTFECVEDEKTKRGSIEIFATGKRSVRVQVTLGDDPHYSELRLLELLERKLHDERGNPPPAPSGAGEAPKAAVPDGGVQ